jgi:hypothetical protein
MGAIAELIEAIVDAGVRSGAIAGWQYANSQEQ